MGEFIDMIKFSIIVPVYNVSIFLTQCIESIINQTYRNLEIICIDDGSTDGSEDILDRYAQQDKRIKVIHKTNSGYGHTLNLGIMMAEGEYIGIVESDDYIAPDMYEKLGKNILDSQGIEIIKASYFKLSRQNCIDQNLFDDSMCNRVLEPQECINLFWIPCSIWTAVYQKEFLIKNNIKFLETSGASYQDTSFWFKVLSRAKKMILINDALYFYRIDNVSSSINSSAKMFCVCGEIRELERYVTRYRIDTPFLEGAKYAYIYRTYMWNYYRLSIGLKSAFWVEMINEFNRMAQSPEFRCVYWRDSDWKFVNAILADPEKFFWDSVPEIKKMDFDQYTAKDIIYAEFIKSYLGRQNKIVIYGAGIYGRQVWDYIKSQGWKERVIGFAVTNQENEPKKIEDKCVYQIDEFLNERDTVMVIVAVKEVNQMNILKYLRTMHFKNVIRVDRVFKDMMQEKIEKDTDTGVG